MDAHGPSLWATLGAVNARRTARPSRRTRGGATLVAMTTRSLILAAGALELELALAAGGIIAGFRHGDTDLMRAPDRALIAAGNPRGGASWPLVPYSNRIRDGILSWRGQRIALARDSLSGDHAIHGNGWRHAWHIAAEDQRRAHLLHAHAGDAFWPFAYAAEQEFVLDEQGFDLTMRLTNTGDGDMPAGLGHHPYFRRSADARLDVGLGRMWRTDAALFPQALVDLPADGDFTGGRAVDPLHLDAVFVGWRRPARIDWPSDGLALDISADPVFDRLVVFIPPGQPFFAVEPVSHDTDGFNHPERDSGARILAPGATLSGTMRFTVHRR